MRFVLPAVDQHLSDKSVFMGAEKSVCVIDCAAAAVDKPRSVAAFAEEEIVGQMIGGIFPFTCQRHMERDDVRLFGYRIQ
jgi:hypothetical protein